MIAPAARVTPETRFVRQASPIRVRRLNFREVIKSWFPVVIWIAVIFLGSTDLMSAEHTSRFITPFLRWLKPDISVAAIVQVHFFVRKTAHLSEYAILATLIFRALRQVMARFQWRALAALFSAVLFASADEFHQSFVTSRTASLGDVGIDSIGAVVGLLLCGMFYLGRGRRKLR